MRTGATTFHLPIEFKKHSKTLKPDLIIIRFESNVRLSLAFPLRDAYNLIIAIFRFRFKEKKNI